MFLEDAEGFCEEDESGHQKVSLGKEKSKEVEVIQLKSNIIPPYFVSLERLFNHHDTYVKKKRVEKGPTTGEYEGVNIGTEESPKMINLGKCCTPKEQEEAKKLFLGYQDVFS